MYVLGEVEEAAANINGKANAALRKKFLKFIFVLRLFNYEHHSLSFTLSAIDLFRNSICLLKSIFWASFSPTFSTMSMDMCSKFDGKSA